MRCTVTLALAAALLIACGDDGGAADPADAAAGGADASAEVRTDVGLQADDGTNLTGYLTTGPASPAGSPGVLLIHQFQQNDEQWGDLPERLSAAGYRVLAFNLRGHGDSDPYDGTLTGLLTDPDAAPADMDAALAYLTGDGAADGDRIAIIGTSIGANLAVSAAIRDLATTYVSLSSTQARAETFAGSPAGTSLASIFYLAADGDGGAATEATNMHAITAEPRQLQIYSGPDHGIAILRNQADATGMVESWLSATL
jgi:dienelactone hydrolase